MSCDVQQLYLENFHEQFEEGLELFVYNSEKAKKLLKSLIINDIENHDLSGFDELEDTHKLFAMWIKDLN